MSGNVKIKVCIYIVPYINKLDCSSAVRQESAFSLARSPCLHTRTSDTADMHLYVAPVFTTVVFAITWICRSPRGGRLSWPTHTGQFTNRVVTCQPQIRRCSGKDWWSEIDIPSFSNHCATCAKHSLCGRTWCVMQHELFHREKQLGHVCCCCDTTAFPNLFWSVTQNRTPTLDHYPSPTPK